jgi:Cu-Zn family superoxide dismutase
MNKMKAIKSNIAIILAFLLGFGYLTHLKAQDKSAAVAHGSMMTAAPQKAVCIIYPTKGNNVSGTINFTKVQGGIRVVADLEGLAPGNHGIHIHEFGDCSAADGTSAGGHFNPMNEPHAGPADKMRHVGDMGNIVADENGKAHLDYVDTDMSFEGMHSIIGRSVIVHAGQDDLKTQPTGNSGARVGCGVIGIAK